MNSYSIAEIISYIFHPFTMVILVTFTSGVTSKGILYSTGSLMLMLVIVLIPLALFIRHKVKNSKWENIDASNKGERPSFYITIITLLLVLIIFLSVFSLFVFLIKGILTIIVLLLIHALLNKYIKASLHTAFFLFSTIVIYRFYPSAGYVLAAFIPVLVWTRLKLKRHTLPEITAGILTGSAAGVITVLI